MTSMLHKVAASGAAVVPPVLVPLANKQLEVARMSVEQAAAYEAGTKDEFQLVKGSGHFLLTPKEPGASHAAIRVSGHNLGNNVHSERIC